MTTHEKTKTQLTLPSDREIVVSRTFDAPRRLVWQAWTKAEHLTQWWGPKGWTLPVCEVDFRPGGTWFYCMQGPDGMLACGKATYSEIEEPRRIIYQDSFVDSDGNALDGMPLSQVTVEFTDQGSKTFVKSTNVYASKADRDKVIEMGMEPGIDQTLDRLEALLKSMQ